MASITAEGLTKVYPNGFEAVTGLDLEVGDGELVVLVGPSGCGKTTALRMVAGLEPITGGTLRIGDRVVNHLSPKDRDIAMVFQNYALYPHMTVADNIGFGLRLRRGERDEVTRRVTEAAKVLGLTAVLDRKPAQLSGGQRQRVAMGRAIVREPAAFLMDEPLSNLDAKLRVQMRAEVMRIQRSLGVATLYVTHDQTEAMTMGDRVAVLRGGTLQQYDAPGVVYDRPANVFVAAFIGSPAMNLFAARLDTDGTRLAVGGEHIAVDAAAAGLDAYRGSEVTVGIRPEHLRLGAPALAGTAGAGAGGSGTPEAGASLSGVVQLVEALGSEQLVHLLPSAQMIDADALTGPGGSGVGAPLAVARIEPTAQVRVGEAVHLGVDPATLHFFDPTTGQAVRP